MSKWRPIRFGIADIVFENDDLIVINKKYGWLMHATLDKSRPHLLGAVQSYLKSRDSHGDNDGVAPSPSIHHRLDVHTTGVVALAKSKRGRRLLARNFEKRLARKHYIAICEGKPAVRAGVIHSYLAPRKVGRPKVEKMQPVARGGKFARTRFSHLMAVNGGQLCAFSITTGRRHQIRAHCEALGTPIVGDSLYGAQNEGPIKLHALRLQITTDNGPLTFVAPPPLDFFAPVHNTCAAAVLFNKPHGVLCQFSAKHQRDRTLADYDLPADLYPVGRLDKDSEGLVLLSADKADHQLASAQQKVWKRYVVQVEHVATAAQAAQLASGVIIAGKRTRAARARTIAQPSWLWPREPPVRYRKTVPTSWLEIAITEGRNRQIRKMCAAVGLPVLRLIRVAIGPHELADLAPGAARPVDHQFR